MRALPAVVLLAAALLVADERAAREPAATAGSAFAARACWQCHAVARDVDGRPAVPAPEGSRRTGPVLGPDLLERSEAWQLANLWAPRAVAADSAMPAYRDLFRPPDEAVAAFVARHDSRDGGADEDGIVTRAEYGGADWEAVLARLDRTRNEIVSAADGAPQPGPEAAALARWLAGLGSRPRAPLDDPAGPSPLRAARDVHDTARAIERGRTLYRRHCAGCHGVRADGNGPVAMFFGNHPPRNFLRGEYRYRSTPVGLPPLDADLYRTIRRGLGGSMPAWPALADAQVWALVEYLKSCHPMYLPRELFVTGAASHAFVAGTDGEPTAAGVDLPGGRVRKRGGRWLWNGRPIEDGETVRAGERSYTFRLGRAVYDWMEEARPEAVAVPEPPFSWSRASAEKGAAVYRAMGCASCHGEQGRGDGPAARSSRANPE